MVERLTGLPYAEAVQRQLLAPLGMHNTGVIPDGARLARGYVHDVPVNPTSVRDIPAGGLCSNVLDLARLMRGVFAGGTLDGQHVLDKDLLAATFEPQYPTGCSISANVLVWAGCWAVCRLMAAAKWLGTTAAPRPS